MTWGMRVATRHGPPSRSRPRFNSPERLLHAVRPHRARRLRPKEHRVEAGAALLFVAAAGALAALVPASRDLPALSAAALAGAYAVASRVRLYVGAGFA